MVLTLALLGSFSARGAIAAITVTAALLTRCRTFGAFGRLIGKKTSLKVHNLLLRQGGGIGAVDILIDRVSGRTGCACVRPAAAFGTALIAQVGPKLIAFCGAGRLDALDSLAAVATAAATTAATLGIARRALLAGFCSGGFP